MQDSELFGPWFTSSQSWETWRTFAKTLFGEPLTATEIEIFTRHTGRHTPPTVTAREAWLPVGRRGGKSLFAAALAVYMACFREYRARLKPGERAVVMVLAADKDQAAVVFDYIKAFFEHVELLGPVLWTNEAKSRYSSRTMSRSGFRSPRSAAFAVARWRARSWMNVPSGTATKRAGTPTPRSSRP